MSKILRNDEFYGKNRKKLFELPVGTSDLDNTKQTLGADEDFAFK